MQPATPQGLDDDLPIVRRCLKGDGSAQELLVRRYQGPVFGLCFRLLGHRQDAEDVTQEVLVRALRGLAGWDQTRPLRPWLLAIAVNRCRTAIARRARRPATLEYLHELPDRRPPTDGQDLGEEIARAVAELRPEYRTAFTLFHEQALPYDEIARILDCPLGTVKTWLHRARRELLGHLRRRGFVTEAQHELR